MQIEQAALQPYPQPEAVHSVVEEPGYRCLPHVYLSQGTTLLEMCLLPSCTVCGIDISISFLPHLVFVLTEAAGSDCS